MKYYTRHMRVFNYTRPLYGKEQWSIAYKRSVSGSLTLSLRNNPYWRSVKAIRRDNQSRFGRVLFRTNTLMDNMRIRNFFRSYSTRHPYARKWRS